MEVRYALAEQVSITWVFFYAQPHTTDIYITIYMYILLHSLYIYVVSYTDAGLDYLEATAFKGVTSLCDLLQYLLVIAF